MQHEFAKNIEKKIVQQTKTPVAQTKQQRYVRTHTTTGKPVAKYTLVAVFKPEFYSRKEAVNEETGEILPKITTGWTYRCDVEREKLESEHGLDTQFYTDFDILCLVFNNLRERFARATCYDNHTNKKIFFYNGLSFLPQIGQTAEDLQRLENKLISLKQAKFKQ